jgi:hypothetical protein
MIEVCLWARTLAGVFIRNGEFVYSIKSNHSGKLGRLMGYRRREEPNVKGKTKGLGTEITGCMIQ